MSGRVHVCGLVDYIICLRAKVANITLSIRAVIIILFRATYRVYIYYCECDHHCSVNNSILRATYRVYIYFGHHLLLRVVAIIAAIIIVLGQYPNHEYRTSKNE